MKHTIETLQWGIEAMEKTLAVYKKIGAKQSIIEEFEERIEEDKAEVEKLKKVSK